MRPLLTIGAVAISLCIAAPGAAQDVASYPTKPVMLVVPFPPGGPTDALGRLLAQKLTELARMRRLDDMAARYRTVAEDYAAKWQAMADDGDHYRLAFDRPGTWSQKYNLAWDTVFGLTLFPHEVVRKELAYYARQRLGYGAPLDSRSKAAKPEWAIWVATMAENKEAFEDFLAPIYRYVCETPNRVPIADIYLADTGRRRANQARSVVGGFFMKLLADQLLRQSPS